MWSLRSLEHASVIQKLTILEHKNGLVLSNTRVPVSGTWSILFPTFEKKYESCTSILDESEARITLLCTRQVLDIQIRNQLQSMIYSHKSVKYTLFNDGSRLYVGDEKASY